MKMGNSITSGAVLSSDPDDENPQADAPVVVTTRTHLMCLSRAHNNFALGLFQELASDGKRPGNFVYSPLALGLGLGMVYLGTRGDSREQMHAALSLNEVQEEQLMPAFAAMHWDLMRSTMPKGCQIEMAVRLFIPTERSLTPDFEAVFNEFEISRVRKADFVGNPEVASGDINRWIEDRTRGKVKGALPAGLVDDSCRGLLVTAVYLRAQWLNQFDSRKTEMAKFHLHGKESDSGVTKLESRLSRSVLETVTDHLQDQMVQLFLPRFIYQQGFNPSESLQHQGIASIFAAAEADLSGIDGTRDLYVSKVFQHITIQVDEVGGENVPVTSMYDDVMGAGSKHFKSGKDKVFRVDRPFIFFIRDDRTGAILVIGRIARPAE